jgi:hypothetical protein
MQTPDITAAQVLSIIASLVTLAVSNLWIDSDTGKLVTEIAAIVVPAVWILADAIIRHGRASNAAAIMQMKANLDVDHPKVSA